MRIRHLILVTILPILAIGAWGQGDPTEGSPRSGNNAGLQTDADEADAAIELRTGTYRILTPADHDLYSRAFAAADRGDWRAARTLAAQGRNGLADKLLSWRQLMARDSGARFEDIDAFLKANPDWPGRDTLFARAEAQIARTAPPAFVIGWFAEREPASAIGMIRLGLAQLTGGNRDAGAKTIRKGWIQGSFDTAEELFIVQHAGALLTPDIDAERLDSLLWRGDIASAKRQMARVRDPLRIIAEARIALRTSAKNPTRIVSALPPALADDPMLQFDRASALRRDGDTETPRMILQRIPLAPIARAHARVLWRELSIAIRQALQDGEAKTAYRMAAEAGFIPGARFAENAITGQGTEYAEAQFMAGWIALRFLKEPALALGHFDRFIAHVSRPISIGRGQYWRGRACEASGDIAAAVTAYRIAAKESETFYGQLALTRIEETPVLRVRETPAKLLPPLASFEQDELVRAMRVLADLGEQALLRRFAMQYQALHPEPGRTKRLAHLMASVGFMPVAVRLAKNTGYDGIWFPAFSHPVIAIPSYQGPITPPEPALVLSLIRQETEFDPSAVSHAGARGLMQIMPATARKLSRVANLPFRPNDLTRDPTYNMRLGMAEYGGYLADWAGSISLAAAAYNAGATNAKRWIATFGDPREPATDPIDWIEQITYGETRNYVQRVIENLQVYRARLNGGAARLRILSDLYGSGPTPKVLHYTPPPPPPPPQAEKPKLKRRR